MTNRLRDWDSDKVGGGPNICEICVTSFLDGPLGYILRSCWRSFNLHVPQSQVKFGVTWLYCENWSERTSLSNCQHFYFSRFSHRPSRELGDAQRRRADISSNQTIAIPLRYPIALFRTPPCFVNYLSLLRASPSCCSDKSIFSYLTFASKGTHFLLYAKFSTLWGCEMAAIKWRIVECYLTESKSVIKSKTC